jgi:tetratricopeptide (TPR) repeat protein
VVELPGVAPASLLQLASLRTEQSARVDAELHADIGELLSRAESLGADPSALARGRARVDLALGTPEALARARAQVEPGIGQYPKDVELRLVYVRTLIALGEVEAATENARSGVRRVPAGENGRLYLEWARAVQASGSARAAVRIAHDGWERVRKEDLPARELLRAGKAAIRAWQSQRKKDLARRIGRELTTALPDHGEAWATRAEIELDTGKAEEGCESARKATAQEPPFASAFAVMGRCHLAQGRRSEAAAAYERAAELAAGSESEPVYRRLARRK